jgi:hypothetical protein
MGASAAGHPHAWTIQCRDGAGARDRVGIILASLMSRRTAHRPTNNQSAAPTASQATEASLRTAGVIDGLMSLLRVQHPIGMSQFMRGHSASGCRLGAGTGR